MMKKNRLRGRWIQMYTNRCKLLPTLGSYKPAQLEKAQQRMAVPDLPKIDFQNRDLFTSRVCSSAVHLIDAPDIACLRSKGMCLVTEDEVLHTKRYTTDTLDVCKPALATPRASLRTPTISTIRLRELIRSTQKRSNQTFLEHTKNATLAHQMENERRNLIRRQIEGRLMTSRAYYYKTLVNASLCMSNADSATRKYVSEALDDHHKEILSQIKKPTRLSADDKDSANISFREWKNSALNLVNQQGEDDLRKVAGFIKFIKQPKTVKQKLKSSSKVSQMSAKESSKTVSSKAHVTSKTLLEKLPTLKMGKAPGQRGVKPASAIITDAQRSDTVSVVSSGDTSTS